MRFIKIFCLLVFTASFANAQDATSLYNEGVKLKGEKNPSAAIEKFKKAVELRPGYTEALYEIGWCQNDLKQYSAAVETLRKVRRAWSTYAKVFFELGYAFEKTDMYDSAIYAYNKAIEINPSYSLAHKQIGYIAYFKDEHEKSLMHYARYEASEAEKGKTITDYLYWYRKGYAQNALKQYENAKPSLNKSLEYKTDYINTYLELGFASSRLKQDENAIGYYKKAIEIDPKSHIPYNGIGEVYRDNKKDMEKSMEWYGKALQIDFNERKANFGVGYCLNSLSRYNEAIPYLKRAIQAEPTYVAAYTEIGYSYFKNDDNALAEINLKKAIELNSKNENSRYYLGLIYIAKNNKIKAQQMADELKALNSKNASSLQEKINKM
ncbi:MAG TPA: tetratricopeptide repeat protein [Ferruginibacter sp.]|nr:tetratricopeptide repeat protein [Ferruginibacter sp.]